MKALFGKRLPYFLVLVVLEIIVILILVVWLFKDTSGFFTSIYNFIAKSSVFFNILDFIARWAEVISGVIILTALIITYISFRKYMRGRAINRLHSWARNGVVVLAQYRQESPGGRGSGSERFKEAASLIGKLMVGSSQAFSDARKLSGEISTRARKTVEELRAAKRKLANGDESLFDDLQALQHEFADVMILAFELIK